MQLESHYDTIFIGHNYLSTMTAVMNHRLGAKVLLVNDRKVNSGSGIFSSFSLLEKNFLEAWNEKDKLGMEHLWEGNFTQENLLFHWNSTWLRLGNHIPSRNLLELQRKVSHLLAVNETLANEDFDREYHTYVNQIVALWSQSPTLKNIETILDTLIPGDRIKQLIETSYAAYAEHVHTSQEVLEFSLFLEAQYGGRIQFPLQKGQFIFLLLKLLSPRFYFQKNKDAEMVSLLKEQGILVKEATIQGIQTKGGGGSLLLDSFDGVVHAKKIVLMGEFPHDSLFQLKSSFPKLRSLEFSFYSPLHGESEAPHITLVHHPGMGKLEFCGLKIYRGSGDLWQGSIFVQEKDGDKEAFYRQELEEMLKKVFHYYFADDSVSLTTLVISFGRDMKLLMHDFSKRELIKENNIKLTRLGIHEHITPTKSREMGGILYNGPLRNNSLGLFSYLLDTKLRFSKPL